MFLLFQLESLLQLWLTLSLNICSGGSEESGSDIFLFNASRVPTIPLNQGKDSTILSLLHNSSDRIVEAESVTCRFTLTVFFLIKFYIFTYMSCLCMCVSSIHQQFSYSAGMVPEHLPENMVPGATLSHPDDEHASLRSVLSTLTAFPSTQTDNFSVRWVSCERALSLYPQC